MNAAKLKLLPFELEVTSGPHLGQKFSFVETSSITIGRGTENQICLQHDPRTSRVHVEIKQENEVFYVYNKTNKNSLFINGHKEDQYKIHQACTIGIGETELKFSVAPTPKQFKNPLQPIVPTHAPMGIQQSSFQSPIPFQNQIPGPILKMAPPAPQQMPYVGQAPQTNQGSGQRKRRPIKKNETFNPIFLVVIAAVILGIIFVLPSKKQDENTPSGGGAEIITPVFRDELRLKEAMDRAKEALTKMENQNSRQAMAQQFFISGMREFLNGNYHRAVSLLNSAFQSDPTLIDAEKFAREAQLKLDRLIDFYFSEGLKYRESNNFRMCKSSFQTVQLYIRGNLKHPRYIEAKQFYDECSNLDKVRRF